MTTLLQFIEQPNGQFLSPDGRLCVVPTSVFERMMAICGERFFRSDLDAAARPDVSSCVVRLPESKQTKAGDDLYNVGRCTGWNACLAEIQRDMGGEGV